MNVVRLHVGNVENVRNNYITRVTEDEVRHESGRRHTRHNLGTGEQMRGSDVTRAQGVQPTDGLFGSMLASAFAFIFGVEGMQTAREGRDATEAEQDLVEQMRAALREGNT